MFNVVKVERERERERTTTCSFSTSIRLLSTSEARYIKNKFYTTSPTYYLVILSYSLLSYLISHT